MSDDAETAVRSRRTPLLLVVVVIGAAAAIFITTQVTQQRIARNEQAWFQEQLHAVLNGVSFDNDPFNESMQIVAPDLGTLRPMPAYLARRQKQTVAIALTTIAPDGYRGPMTLLIGIDASERIVGLRVLAHQETPGLGDAFEKRGSHWLEAFIGRSLQSPPQQRWAVRKDGGDFDQFTGATVTPRAIVKATRHALEYVHAHHQQFFPSS